MRVGFTATLVRLLIGVLCAAGQAYAGTIILSNGDRLSGELMEIVEGQVRWHSPMLGEITLPQINVASIETRKQYHVQLGSEQRLSSCVLQLQPEQRRQVLNCREGLVEITDWQLIARVSDLPLLERDRWRSNGFVTAAAKNSSGRVEQEAYALDLRVELRHGDHRNTLVTEYDVEHSGGAKIIDQYKFSYQYDRFVSEQVFLHGSYAAEHNEFREWSSRETFGAGVGYQFFNTGLASLSMETGLAWQREDMRSQNDKKLLAWRLNTDFRWLVSRFGLEFFHRSIYLQSLDYGADWDFESDTGFKLPLIGRLSSEVKLEYDYDNNAPSEGVEKLEQTWSAGLRYDW